MAEPLTVRTFIATIPEPEVAKRLIDAYQGFKHIAAAKNIRWINRANLHVTVRFLGNLTAGQLDQLPHELSLKLAGYQPCSLRFDRIIWFPSEKRPRVIATNFKSCPDFHAIALRAELASRAIGVNPDRRTFRPHLSLGLLKNKGPAPFDLQQPITDLTMPVQKLSVLRSELTQSGPKYSELFSLPLGT